MKKQDILKKHGLTEAEFYKLYPTEEHYRMAMGGTHDLPKGKEGGPLFNPFIPDFFNTQFILENGGTPKMGTGGGSKAAWEKEMQGKGYAVNPYDRANYYDPKKFSITPTNEKENPWAITNLQTNQSSSQFNAADVMSYKAPVSKGVYKAPPQWIPTGTDPSGAGLFKKGTEPQGPSYVFTNGQYVPYTESIAANKAPMQSVIQQFGGDISIPTISSKESLNMFRDVIKKMGGPAYPGQTQDSIIDSKKNDFLQFIRTNTMDAIAREEALGMHQMPDGNMMSDAMMQGGGSNMQDYRTDPFQNKFSPYNRSNGMSYFPMNFNPYMKMSNKDIETYQQLAKNPTSNLKSFKERHFGPWGKTVMEFGAKDKLQPFIPTGQVNLGQGESEYIPSRNTPQNPLDAGIKQTQVEKMMNPFSQDAQRQMMIMNGLGRTYPENPNEEPFSFEKATMKKAYGGMPTYQGNIFGSQTGSPWDFQGAQQPIDYRGAAFGNQPAPIMMSGDNLDPVSGDPLTNYGDEKNYNITQKTRPGINGEDAANWTLAGMSGIASLFEQRQNRKDLEKYKSTLGADNQFYAQKSGNRGDYDQFGNMRLDQKVPVQFAGQNYGQSGSPYQFQEGGEYYMTDDEINGIMKAGGEIDFLD